MSDDPRESLRPPTPKPSRPRSGEDFEDDPALVAALKIGDEAAVATLVCRYSGRMLQTARRLMGNDEDAHDCTQEALIQAWKKIETFEERASLGTWLHRIVTNCCLMRLRSRKRRREQSIDELMPQFDGDGYLIGPTRVTDRDPLALLESKGNRELVRTTIDQLPESFRTILILRDIEGLNTKEVSEALGISLSLAKTRLHRARTALRKKLEPLWQEGAE